MKPQRRSVGVWDVGLVVVSVVVIVSTDGNRTDSDVCIAHTCSPSAHRLSARPQYLQLSRHRQSPSQPMRPDHLLTYPKQRWRHIPLWCVLGVFMCILSTPLPLCDKHVSSLWPRQLVFTLATLAATRCWWGRQCGGEVVGWSNYKRHIERAF